jgi:hypothetical protein
MINLFLQVRTIHVPYSTGHGQIDPKMILATYIVLNICMVAALVLDYTQKIKSPYFKNQSALKNFFYSLHTDSDIQRQKKYESVTGYKTDAYNPTPTIATISFFVINGLALLYCLSYLVYKFIIL